MSLELHAQRQALEELWEQGLSGHQLLQQHTALVDGCILDHFQASPAVGATRGEIALIALGDTVAGNSIPILMWISCSFMIARPRRICRPWQSLSSIPSGMRDLM